MNARVYFSAGDKVIVKHDISNRPTMLVKSIDKTTLPGDNGGLLGITCIWFDKNQTFQSFRFSTKDLMHKKDD